MSVPILPAGAQMLFSCHLNPDTWTLVGAIPNQYATGISVYVSNDDPYSTIMAQVIVSRHQSANAANVFNKTVYIPARNVAKFERMSNVAGLNIFVKASGTHVSSYIAYIPQSESGNQIIDVTPNVVNQNQSITPMPPPQASTSNSIGSQLLMLSGQVATLTNSLSTLQAQVNQLTTQVTFLNTFNKQNQTNIENLSAAINQ